MTLPPPSLGALRQFHESDGPIEHGAPLAFATRLTALVHNVDARGAVAYVEMIDVAATMCWLLKDQMLAKCNAGFDEIADDKAALSQQQREEMEAQINLPKRAMPACDAG